MSGLVVLLVPARRVASILSMLQPHQELARYGNSAITRSVPFGQLKGPLRCTATKTRETTLSGVP